MITSLPLSNQIALAELRLKQSREEQARIRKEQKKAEAEQLADTIKAFKAGEPVAVQKKRTVIQGTFVDVTKHGTARVKRDNGSVIEVPFSTLQIPSSLTMETTPEAATATATTTTATETATEAQTIPQTEPQTDCVAGEFFCNETLIETRSQSIPARYAVMELDKLVTSHNPQNFSEDSRYPSGCQQRDYKSDKAEQLKVQTIAKQLKPQFLINATPTATDGAPIVTKEGIVMGGNGRTMGLKLYATTSDYTNYVQYLKRSALIFGLDTTKLDSFKHPVLVRVIDEDVSGDKCALISNILNKNLTQEVDFTTETISLARQLNEGDLKSIAAVFEESGAGSFSEFLQSQRAVKEVVGLLRRKNVINDQNVSQFLDPATSKLSPLGRLNVERILLGALLTDKQLVDAAQNYTNAIIRALPVLVKAKLMPKEWDIMGLIQNAIKLEAERRAAGTVKNLFLNQTTFDRSTIDPETLAVWNALDSGQVGFKAFVDRYIKRATIESEPDAFGFTSRLTRREVLAKVSADAGLSDDASSLPKLPNLRTSYKTPKYHALSPRWKKFLGAVEDPFSMMVWGNYGGGKSTLTLLLANELQRLGNVLYISSEQSIERILTTARRVGVSSPRIQVLVTKELHQIRQHLASGKYTFAILDSLNAVKGAQQDTFGMKDEFPEVNMTFIVQSIKDGRFYSGIQDSAFLVDVVVQVENGLATTEKNRFGKTGEVFKIYER